jgi:hypothetical protein
MKPTDAELFVCNALVEPLQNEEIVEYHGDEFYPFVKNSLSFLPKEKDISKPHFESLKKKDKIIKENTLRLIHTTLAKINFDMKNLLIPKIFSSKTLELRGVCFMYVCQFYLENDTTDLLGPFSIIVSSQRFLEKVKDTPYSKMAMKDLNTLLEKLIEKYKYDGKRLFEQAPELISNSVYDAFVPALQARPYEHQMQAMQLLENAESIKNGFVCIYSTSTNSGKTFTSVGIASRIQNIASVTFLFVCDIKLVREKVRALLHYSNIKSYKVCSPDQAYELLKDIDSRTKYVLFIDEIALNSHFKSDTLVSHMKLFSVAPKWVYLSGANLNAAKLDFFHQVHSARFENSKYVVISTNKIFSSVSAFTFEGEEVLPHMYCKTIADLKVQMESILINQFKGRMYTPVTNSRLLEKAMRFVTWSLCENENEISDEEMKEINVWKKKFPDIQKIFSQVSQIYPDNIRKIAMTLLSTVVEFEDDYMVEVISKSSNVTTKIDLLKLDYHLFPNINIVAHPDPEKFANLMFNPILKTLRSKIGSFQSLHSKYQCDLNSWQDRINAIEKSIKNEKERAIQLDGIKSDPPKIAFPPEFQINTKEYCAKRGVVLKKYRRALDLESIDADCINNEALLLLMYMGVGVYYSKGPKAYTDQVLKLVSEGKLEFLITDVCYGFDYSFGALFITKEFSDEKSTSDIFQLMSRIGRGRLSYVGQVYMDKTCTEKILGKDDTTNLEIANMFDVLLSST